MSPSECPLLSPEHGAFRDVCRSFVEHRVLPLVAQAEDDGSFPSVLWAQMAGAGLLGLGYPEEVGGSGGNTLSIAILAEELAKASGGIAITPLVSSYMAAPHLHHHGNSEQVERYLRPVLGGKKVAAIAVSEPEAGSDVAGITLKATPERDGYRLSGTKFFITNGGIADVVIVAARTGAATGHSTLTMFLVEPGQPGFVVGRALQKLGWHSSDTRELIFDDCLVAHGAVVGEVGRGFYQIMQAFQRERIVLAAMGVGLADACLKVATEYAKNRRAFGQTIGSFQAVRHGLAHMSTEIEAARLLTYQAAVLTDSGGDSSEAVAMAKLHAARTANDVADRALQVFGGAGFLEETPVAMHYRDARVLRIGGGTDEIQMEILAKRMGL